MGLNEEYPNSGFKGNQPPSIALRLWPQPKKVISWSLPDIIRYPLDEAERCFHAGAYSACAVMSGKAIEGICVHHKTKAKTLSRGFKELLDNGIIDKRLHEWGNELRILRNIGAHATTEKVQKDDARDMLDFANAICDYVFVLNKKFKEFQNRRNKKGKGK